MATPRIRDLYACFRCYRRNVRPGGRCRHCGGEIAPPDGLSFDDLLVWTLRHPDPDRAMIAARALGRRRARSAVHALRRVVDDPPDPYVGAKALESLVAIRGIEEERELVERVAAEGPVILAAAARRALTDGGGTSA